MSGPTPPPAGALTFYRFDSFRLQADTDEGAGIWGKGPAAQDTAGTTVVNPLAGRKVAALVVAAAAMKGREMAEGGVEGGAEGGQEETARAEKGGKGYTWHID